MGSHVLHYEVDSERDAAGLLERIRERFRVRMRAPREEAVRYMDTFDRRVHRAGAWLRVAPNGTGLALTWVEGPREEAATLAVAHPPAFGAELAAEPVASGLVQLVGPRRILHVAEVERRSQALEILDAAGAILGRAVLVRGRVRAPDGDWRAAPITVRLEGFAGHESERHALERLLADVGSPRSGSLEHDDLVRALGAEAARNPSRPALELHEGDTIGVALRAILSAQLGVVQANLNGLLEQLDAEFLHDVRVAVRRTRAVLADVKGVPPKKATKHLRDELRWLGQVSGPARDLDVLLAELPGYVSGAGVSEESPAVVALRAELERRRAGEQEHMAHELTGERAAALFARWSELASEGHGKPPGKGSKRRKRAGRSARAVASRRIRKRYRAMIRHGSGIERDSAPAALHELRLDCKKLRYLLELFRSLYDVQAIGRFLKSLKRLQDHLGTFNDVHIHEGILREATRSLAGTEGISDGAVARILDALPRRAGQARERFEHELPRFASEELDALAEELFGGEKGRR